MSVMNCPINNVVHHQHGQQRQHGVKNKGERVHINLQKVNIFIESQATFEHS